MSWFLKKTSSWAPATSNFPGPSKEVPDVLCASSRVSTVSSFSTTDVSTLSEEGEGSSFVAETEEEADDRHKGMYGILSREKYEAEYGMGDVSRDLWIQCETNVNEFNGRWQIMLGRSDCIDAILKELGVGLIGRTVMARYVSEAEFVVMDAQKDTPTIKYISYLAMGRVKQGTILFDGSAVNLPDGDTGIWKTSSCWINGRALQRRESAKGVMMDVRLIFQKDPCGAEKVPVMLFRWSFVARGSTHLMSANRWFKKLK